MASKQVLMTRLTEIILSDQNIKVNKYIEISYIINKIMFKII